MCLDHFPLHKQQQPEVRLKLYIKVDILMVHFQATKNYNNKMWVCSYHERQSAVEIKIPQIIETLSKIWLGVIFLQGLKQL